MRHGAPFDSMGDFFRMARSNRWYLFLALAATLAVGGSAFAAPVATPTPPLRPDELIAIARDADAALDVVDSVSREIRLTRGAAGSLQAHIPIEGDLYTLELRPHSVRAEGFTLTVQQDDGSYRNVAPPAVSTFRGRLLELEGSTVAASVADDGLHARIMLADRSEHWVEPLHAKVAAARRDTHAVYRGDRVIPSGKSCAAAMQAVNVIQDAAPGTVSGGSIAGTGFYVAELAIDTDVEYFNEFGSVSATTARIEQVINTVNLQYERDVQIRHTISHMIIRGSEPDPYFETDPVRLLNQLREQWSVNHGNIRRDTVQLFTGKILIGSTIGIAYVGTICSGSSGYSLVESECCGSFACTTDLSAHELGHNWGASHCLCSQNTMNAGLTCSNVFNSLYTKPDIIPFRDSRTCLDFGDELRRVYVSPETDSVIEGNTLRFTVLATFRVAGTVDVTDQATLTVDPVTLGTFDTRGRLTTNFVDGDTCGVVTASLTSGSITLNDDVGFMVVDVDSIRGIVASIPPDGSIDARQPTDPNGANAQGWQTIDLMYNGETCLTSATDFLMSQDGGTAGEPIVASVTLPTPNTVRLNFASPIVPGAWTVITDVASGDSIRLGYLPGDVSGDGIANGDDIQTLLDALGGSGPALPIWARDVDRSGELSPADMLRVIDLLNGADGFVPWLEVTLPP